jgi:hypothetical protein
MAEGVSDNVAMLMRVVERLAPLRDRLVFLGGAVTEFFITAPGRRSSRHTKDVDVVINVVNLGEYSETLREQLVALGLSEDVREGAPVCRWLLDDPRLESCWTDDMTLGRVYQYWNAPEREAPRPARRSPMAPSRPAPHRRDARHACWSETRSTRHPA